MTGLGTAKLGLIPFGSGTPATSIPLPKLSGQARYLDPSTRDWRVSIDGNWDTMSGTKQRVVLALLTTQGSNKAETSFGNRLSKIATIDDSFPRKVNNVVRAALFQMTDIEKVIKVNAVNVKTNGGQAEITVEWTDFELGTNESFVI